MKPFETFRNITSGRFLQFLVLLTYVFLNSFQASGQFYERVYASQSSGTDISQPLLFGTLANVDNPSRAVNGNIEEASVLSTTVGLLSVIQAYQNVRFPLNNLPPSPSTPVTIKVETGESLIDLLGGIEVQATQNGNPTGILVNNTNLLGLLGGGVLSSGKNVFEITFTPNATYNGVRLRVSPTLGVGVTAKLYHAYFLKAAAAPTNCDTPIDVLYGVNGSIVSLLSGVNSPYAVLTGGTAQLNTGAGVSGDIYETVVFNGPSEGDVEVTLSISPTLLTASLLNNISITAMNGSIPGSTYTLNSLLDIDLLGLFQSGAQTTIRFKSTQPFDRVKISSNGLVSALGNINIHSIHRALAAPVLATSGTIIYQGQTAVLNATSSHGTDKLNWTNLATNASAGSGSSISVSPLQTTNYQVTAQLSENCPILSSPAIATVTVLTPPTVFTNPANGLMNSPYTGFISASGGSPNQPLTYQTTNLSGLPAGLTLNPDGTVSGTPSVFGTFSFEVQMINSDFNIVAATHIFTISVMQPLPVTLTSFSARAENQTVLLSWTTSSETNFDRFEIESSGNGKDWIMLGKQTPTENFNRYNFVDTRPSAGENLYRLKMIDLDGSFAYSRISRIYMSEIDDKISLYPNPAIASDIRISAKNHEQINKITIFNTSGKCMDNNLLINNNLIKTATLAAGIYVVVIVYEDGSTRSGKVSIIK